MADGIPIVVCSVRGTLYAYCDACAACGSSLADGTLTGERLDCPGCGACYDVRSAGRSLDDPDRHLDPLPLLTDSQGSGSRSRRGPRSPEPAGRRFPLTGQGSSPVAGQRACAASSSRPHRAAGPAGPGAPAVPRGAVAPARPGPAGPRARPRRPASCARRRSARSTATWRTWRTPPSAAPAAPATCCSPSPARAAAGTAPSPTATCAIPARPLTAAEWAELDVPVGLAFFLRSSRRGTSAASTRARSSVTECTLDLAAWAPARPGSPAAAGREDGRRGDAGEAAPMPGWSASWCRSTRATSSPGGCGCCGRASTAGRRRGRASPSSSTPVAGPRPRPGPGALTWPNWSSTGWAPGRTVLGGARPHPVPADQRDQRPAGGARSRCGARSGSSRTAARYSEAEARAAARPVR